MEKLNGVPKEKDWGNYLEMGPDIFYAYQKFAGKTVDEVQDYFQTSVLGACECLTHMPEIPFCYYVLALDNYLMYEASLPKCTFDASSGASAFLSLVLDKLKYNPQLILPVMDKLLPLAEYVSSHQERYDADIKIFGSFPEKLREIKTHYKRVLKGEPLPVTIVIDDET